MLFEINFNDNSKNTIKFTKLIISKTRLFTHLTYVCLCFDKIEGNLTVRADDIIRILDFIRVSDM